MVALKYRNGRELGRLLGMAMAELVDPAGLEAVTWAPTSRARRDRRGYDQSRLLARGLAEVVDLPCRDLLRRGAGGPQTGRTLAQRQLGPRFEPRRPSPGGVVVVDDVVTTGATLVAASGALRRGGAARVIGGHRGLHAATRRAPAGTQDRRQVGRDRGRGARNGRLELTHMQVTELQVQRSLRALTGSDPDGSAAPGRTAERR